MGCTLLGPEGWCHNWCSQRFRSTDVWPAGRPPSSVPVSLPFHAKYTSHCQSQTPEPAHKHIESLLFDLQLLSSVNLQNSVRVSDLCRAKQGTLRHFGPEIIIWNQFVMHQAVNTVRLHNSPFVQLVFVWCSDRCARKVFMSPSRRRYAKMIGIASDMKYSHWILDCPPRIFQNSLEALQLTPSSMTWTFLARQPKSLLLWMKFANSEAWKQWW